MSGAPLKSKNREGVWFWFKWIAVSIISFTASLFFWDWLLLKQLGAKFQEPHVAIGWLVAVFGTWFLLLVLLMKKKEVVMGHMDHDDEATLAWWLIWIGLTIGSFFFAVWFWTPFISRHLGSIKNPSVSIVWIVAVFGTWLVALIPLMIFMYYKVDKAYEKARERRERLGESKESPKESGARVRGVLIEPSLRKIPSSVTAVLKKTPLTIRNGHLVTAILKDGRKIENVFIANRSELLGIYGAKELSFNASDIVSVEPTDLNHPHDFTEKQWLRLDGQSV